jgi:hypothetical protein
LQKRPPPWEELEEGMWWSREETEERFKSLEARREAAMAMERSRSSVRRGRATEGRRRTNIAKP